MIEVLPIQSKSEQEVLCARCGVKYDVEAMAYGSQIQGEMTGICQFSIDSQGGHVLTIGRVPGHDDFETVFLLGRAALNFIDLCGVHNAFYVGDVTDELLLKAIGFKENSEGKYEMDLNGFFTDHCH